MYEIDCDLSYCDVCEGDTCVSRRHTYRYYAAKLRAQQEFNRSEALEGFYDRKTFTSGALALAYGEARVGALSDGSCEMFLDDNSDDGYVCGCSFQDCDGVASTAFDCSMFAGNYTFGYCDASQNNIAASTLPMSSPLIAFDDSRFPDTSCFTSAS